MKHLIVAQDQDGLDVRTSVFVLEAPAEVDIVKAVKAACKEFCETETGKKIYEENGNCFNWGDFDTNIPDSICQKHGFSRIDFSMRTMDVDFNEQLYHKE